LEEDIILSVRGLKKYYPVPEPGMKLRKKAVHAVDGIDLDLRKGETLGLVGESGCGKSTTGRLIVGIEKPTSGSIHYKGRDIAGMNSGSMRDIRTELTMIFQDSYSSLNPRKRVVDMIAQPMIYHGRCDRKTAPAEVDRLLEMVGLPKEAKSRYPHEFSGGQRQRIAIARALSLKPSVIVCDEPVSALDMSVQAQILNLMRDLQEELGVTYLFIAHGLGAVRYISHRIAVMYLGKIVETGTAEEIFHRPAHPYSKALIAAVPAADPSLRGKQEEVLSGEVPSAVDLPAGCRFAARCPFADDRCRAKEPALMTVPEKCDDTQHMAACWHMRDGLRDSREDGYHG